MEQNLKINQIISFTQKSKFGKGNYFGYSNKKYLGIIKINTNKKISGFGETLVGVYSPRLFQINISYISKFIKGKNLNNALKELINLRRNKFFFDNGVLKSIISGIEIAIFDILAQVNKINHGKLLKVYFQKNNRIKNEIKIYGSAGSINCNLRELQKDIINAKKIGISTFKARVATNKTFSNKINLLQNEINSFAIDLIANTYKKNENLTKLNYFLKFIRKTKPIWVEEILNTNSLYHFKNLKKYGLKFSYGENYNSLSDFISLIEYYKFNYINPDLSHLSTFDFFSLCKFFDQKNYKNKTIIHCWGGAINFVYSLSVAQAFNQHIKFVEFPLTESNFMNKVLQNIHVSSSICSINDEIKSFEKIIDINSLEKIKTSRLTFNFN